MRIVGTIMVAALLGLAGNAVAALSLGQVHRIYVEGMPNQLDTHLRDEIYKQFRDRVMVVLDRKEADAILAEPPDERTARAARAMSDDVHYGDGTMVYLLDKTGKVILWSGEAGDRNWIQQHRGSRTVAEHLVRKLKRAILTSR